jgi:Tol biopolymer transport system component
MNPSDGFDRTVSAWLHQDAEHRVPQHLDAVLHRTRTERQRPAWSSLERWLPLDTAFRTRVASAPRPGRVLLVVALLIALAGLVIFAVGSRPIRVPPPFGPARNGTLMSSHDGDIFAVDPSSARQTPVITGSPFDFGATFSRDGTKFIFLRGAPTGCGQQDCGLILMVANADGSGVRALTPALPALDWQDWSPDGTQVAIVAGAPGGIGHVIDVVNVDGSGMRTLDVGRPAHEISWLPPDGKEIVFRGEQLQAGDPPSGIFAVRSDGTGLRQISARPAGDSNDYQSIAVSPDGLYVTYQASSLQALFQVHILTIGNGQDRVLPHPPQSAQLGGVFSPDGRMIAYLRAEPDNLMRMVVAPVDGSGTGIALGPRAPFGPDGPTINNYSWSPDGTSVIANYDADKTARLLPIDGSPPTELAHGEQALPAYQRLAP